MFILELSFVSSKQLRSWYTDTPLCPARPEGPVSSQPDAVAHTEWHTDEPNHAPPCVCRAVMLTTSALSQNHRGARRLSLKRDRQRYRQGDERRKAGELDRWVVMMSRGEREWHTAPISAFFFSSTTLSPSFICLPVRFIFFPHLFFLFLICTLSVLLTVSLSLPFIIQCDSSVFLYSS